MSKKNKKKKVVAKSDKKTVAKIDEKVTPNKKSAEAKMAKKAEKKARKMIAPPASLPTKTGKAVNPIVANKRLKRALAVALCMVTKTKVDDDKAVLASAIRISGIPFKQVNTKDDAKDPTPLTKSEWSGRPYASWSAFNQKEYYDDHKEAVDGCMEFAQAVVASLG